MKVYFTKIQKKTTPNKRNDQSASGFSCVFSFVTLPQKNHWTRKKNPAFDAKKTMANLQQLDFERREVSDWPVYVCRNSKWQLSKEFGFHILSGPADYHAQTVLRR